MSKIQDIANDSAHRLIQEARGDQSGNRVPKPAVLSEGDVWNLAKNIAHRIEAMLADEFIGAIKR